MIACFAIAAGAATFADSVRLSEDVARRRHRTTAHSHGETATASGARRRLVRVGRTPWAGAGLSGQPPRRRSPRPSLLRGENAGLNPRSRRPDRYRYERISRRCLPTTSAVAGLRCMGEPGSPWIFPTRTVESLGFGLRQGQALAPKTSPFTNAESRALFPTRTLERSEE